MMREILFRGKTKGGRWAEGNLLVYPDVNRAYIQKGDYFKGGAIEVKRTSIGQFTGVTDKTGNRIFEGDILRWVSPDGESGMVYVKFSGGIFGLQSIECPSADPEIFTDFEVGCQTLEVIGNIHDTPIPPRGGAEWIPGF